MMMHYFFRIIIRLCSFDHVSDMFQGKIHGRRIQLNSILGSYPNTKVKKIGTSKVFSIYKTTLDSIYIKTY